MLLLLQSNTPGCAAPAMYCLALPRPAMYCPGLPCPAGVTVADGAAAAAASA